MGSVTVDIEALRAGIEKDGFFLWKSDTAQPRRTPLIADCGRQGDMLVRKEEGDIK